MALKSLSFVIISALLVASSSLVGVSAVIGGRKALAPGVDPVTLPPTVGVDFVFLNRKDPNVINLAKYAIDEYNKENNSKLVYSAVFETLYSKSEQGAKYRLIVAATNDKRELRGYDIRVLVGKDAKKLSVLKKLE